MCVCVHVCVCMCVCMHVCALTCVQSCECAYSDERNVNVVCDDHSERVKRGKILILCRWCFLLLIGKYRWDMILFI